MILQFPWVKSLGMVSQVFCSGSLQIEINVSTGLKFSSEAQGPLPSSLVTGKIYFFAVVALKYLSPC